MFFEGCQLLKPILIVEDDPHMQKRIGRLLLQFGYQQADLLFSQSIASAKDYLQRYPIQCSMVDLGLPDGNGIDLMNYIHARSFPNVLPMMVLSSWQHREIIYRAMSTGALGYILKERDDFEIMFAIRSMLKGEMMLDPVIAKDMLSQLQLSSNTPRTESTVITKLSARELQILNLVAQGFRSKDIAAQIFISKHTVDVHIKKLYQKLDVHSRTQAVHFAQQVGLI
jgi:DNA-binding NarL/FixJ family response regulator